MTSEAAEGAGEKQAACGGDTAGDAATGGPAAGELHLFVGGKRAGGGQQTEGLTALPKLLAARGLGLGKNPKCRRRVRHLKVTSIGFSESAFSVSAVSLCHLGNTRSPSHQVTFAGSAAAGDAAAGDVPGSSGGAGAACGEPATGRHEWPGAA